MTTKRSSRLGGGSGGLLVAVVMAASSLLVAQEASAQACCTATGAGEFAVVGRCHDGVAAAQLSFERAWGSYDQQGRHNALGSAEVDDVILALGAGQRVITDSLQVHGSVPLRMQYRRFGDAEGTIAAGLGDAAFALRWTALEDRMGGLDLSEAGSLLPFLDVYAGLKVPSGRAPEHSQTSTGADITGDGAWQAIAGAKLSKFVTSSHVLAIQGEYAHRFSREIERSGSATSFDAGEELSAQLSWLQIHDLFWSWGAFGKAQWTLNAREDGAIVEESAMRRLRMGAHLTHGVQFPQWEVTLAASVDAWWSGANRNVPYVGPSAALTLRRNWY